MLALVRREEEDIVLDFRHATDADIARLRAGELIVIKTLETRAEKVHLGLSAPASVKVDRREIYDDRMRNEIERAKSGGRKAGAA